MELTISKDVNPEVDFKIRKAAMGESWVLIYKDKIMSPLNYEEKEAMISILSQAGAYYNFMKANYSNDENLGDVLKPLQNFTEDELKEATGKIMSEQSKLAAVKFYMSTTGATLSEAKKYCDKL